MLRLRSFRKANKSIENSVTRAKYGKLSGAVGIAVNLTLAAAKYAAGVLTGSIAIAADAANNLSDAASSILTLIGFKLSEKPADKDHPYGHGRMEYIIALAVSFLILLMSVELFKTSVDKIRRPDPVVYSTAALVILLCSIAAKLFLALFNGRIAARIHSSAAKAVARDSLSDTAATGVALAALLASKWTDTPVDAPLGIVVSLFIFWSGFGILRDTVTLLLGKPPERDFFERIEAEICSYDGIVGVHDLMIHDYGPGRTFASAHAEVPAHIDILRSHETVDLIERDLLHKYGMHISIHMDPVITDDKSIDNLHDLCREVLDSIDPSLTFHDFRVVEGALQTNLIFDVAAANDLPLSDEQLCTVISERLSKIDERYFAVVTVDHAFN